MLDIFKRAFTFFRRRSVQTDSFVFRLHHSATVALLLVFSLIVGLHQYMKGPIKCSSSDIPLNVLDVHCFTQSTFTAAEAVHKRTGPEIAHPGVSRPSTEGNINALSYYPWVFLSLFFQATLFYAPRWLWKNWEGGKLHALSKDLRVGYLSKEEKAEKRKMLVDYLQENLNNHGGWAGRYMLCEVLALVNVIGQMFYMNYFLGGEFWSYGPRVLGFMASDDGDTLNPKGYVFPKTVKCIFTKYGASGAVVRYDTMCVLPLNIFNGRFYAFLWFWFLLLLILTLAWLMFAISMIRSSKFRIYILRKRFGRIGRKTIARIEHHCGLGDWFLFCMLGENLDSSIFRDVMENLLDRLGKQNSSMVELTEESGTL